MIRPKPFKKVCPLCGWSKVYQPKSDVVDNSWGIGMRCPRCGNEDLKHVHDVGTLDLIMSNLKDSFK